MKLLIIRLGSMGDAVVDFLVKKEYHDLLSANPHLNRIITRVHKIIKWR